MKLKDLPTKISKPDRLVFFKKENCAHDLNVQQQLDEVLYLYPEFRNYAVVMQKENHPALVAAFELKMYPTVLILDATGNEISRKVGSKYLTKEWWINALTALDGGSNEAGV